MAVAAPNTCCSFLSSLSHSATNRFGSSSRLLMSGKVSSKLKHGISLRVQARSTGGEEEEDGSNGISEEDWRYVLKLGAGSVAGAAVVKYGSVVFPEMTRPNILLALIMISTPVIVAIVLLSKQSRV